MAYRVERLTDNLKSLSSNPARFISVTCINLYLACDHKKINKSFCSTLTLLLFYYYFFFLLINLLQFTILQNMIKL